MLPSVLTIVDEEPGKFTFGVCKNVLVTVWRAQGTSPAMARLAVAMRKMAAEYPLGYSALQLVCGSAGLPDSEMRVALSVFIGEVPRELTCVGVIVGGDGFWASALRAVITSFWQAAPRKFELRICGSSEEAARWLSARHLERTGTDVATELLMQAVGAAERRSTEFSESRG